MGAGYQRVACWWTRQQGVMFAFHLLILFAMPGQSQPMQALASTSADTSLPEDILCRDEAILRRDEADVWPRLHTPQQAWMSLLGDVDADGLLDFPDGIDALSYLPAVGGEPPSLFDIVFSSDRDFLGFKDGDVLCLSRAGGVKALLQESDLAAILLPQSGILDLDAIAFSSPSVLRFSLKDSLNGTTLGDLLDGDILEWDSLHGTVQKIATEAQVQAWVDAATGVSSPIGDVKSISFLPSNGEMVFTVQAPTASDATVYGEGNGGHIVSGWEEADWQFQISSEIDALCFIPAALEQPVLLSSDSSYLVPDTVFSLHMRHAEPGVHLTGIAGPTFQILPSSRGGAGYTILDPNALPLHLWPGRSAGPLFADASGVADFQTRTPKLPAGMISVLLWYQVFAHGGGWSSPLLLKVE